MKNLMKWLAELTVMFVVYVIIATLIWYCTKLTNGQLIDKIEYYSLGIVTGLIATPIGMYAGTCVVPKEQRSDALKVVFWGMLAYQIIMVVCTLVNYYYYGFFSNILIRETWSIGTAILFYRWKH